MKSSSYVVGLGLVLENLNEIQNLVAYAVGYGLGVIIGTKTEKMALGYITVNVITVDADNQLPSLIRAQGYGVTHWEANGLEGDRLAIANSDTHATSPVETLYVN